MFASSHQYLICLIRKRGAVGRETAACTYIDFGKQGGNKAKQSCAGHGAMVAKGNHAKKKELHFYKNKKTIECRSSLISNAACDESQYSVWGKGWGGWMREMKC